MPRQSYYHINRVGPIFSVQFDDTNGTDYTLAFPALNALGVPGSSVVFPNDGYTVAAHYPIIGTPNALTAAQMQEMFAAGWQFGLHMSAVSRAYDITSPYPTDSDVQAGMAAGKAAIEQILGAGTCRFYRPHEHKCDQAGLQEAEQIFDWGCMLSPGYGTAVINQPSQNTSRYPDSPDGRFQAQAYPVLGGIDETASPMTASLINEAIRDATLAKCSNYVLFGHKLEVPGQPYTTVAWLNNVLNYLLDRGAIFVTAAQFNDLVVHGVNHLWSRENVNLFGVNGECRLRHGDIDSSGNRSFPDYFANDAGGRNSVCSCGWLSLMSNPTQECFFSGGPISDLSGAECGYYYPSSLFDLGTSIMCPIMVPGHYRLTFQYRRHNDATPATACKAHIWFDTGPTYWWYSVDLAHHPGFAYPAGVTNAGVSISPLPAAGSGWNNRFSYEFDIPPGVQVFACTPDGGKGLDFSNFQLVRLSSQPINPAVSASNSRVSVTPTQCTVSWDSPTDPGVATIMVRYDPFVQPRTPQEGQLFGTITCVPGTGQSIAMPVANWSNESLRFFSVFAMQSGSPNAPYAPPDLLMFAVDKTAPSPPTLSTTTGANGTVTLNWSCSDPDSGIYQYKYALGRSPGRDDLVHWTYTAQASAMFPASGLVRYASVKAQNPFGYWSAITNRTLSAGIIVGDFYPDGSDITVEGIISAIFGDCYYVQLEDRARGMKIMGQTSSSEGDSVTITGHMTTANGERVLMPE